MYVLIYSYHNGGLEGGGCSAGLCRGVLDGLGLTTQGRLHNTTKAMEVMRTTHKQQPWKSRK
jgi:hypothetical protein